MRTDEPNAVRVRITERGEVLLRLVNHPQMFTEDEIMEMGVKVFSEGYQRGRTQGKSEAIAEAAATFIAVLVLAGGFVLGAFWLTDF